MSSRQALFTIILILFPCLLALPAGAAAPERPYAAGELLVKFKPASRDVSRSALQQAAGVRHTLNVGRSRIQRMVLDPEASMDQALALYARDPNVEFVEPNYLLYPQTMPDDTHFTRQWGLYNTGQMVGGYVGTPGVDMDMDDAWNITRGDRQVVVAVVDTGCDLNHPDLAANIWTNPGEIPDNGVDDDGNGYIDDVHGWDFSDNDNIPQDATGHGTHVAGIIAAGGDNSRGVAGVAWQAGIMPLRFMNALEIGTTADAIQAIYYALDQGARIINCSWGTTGYSAALKSVIDNANALFVCAAGNSGIDIDDAAFYPASFPSANIISVGASDQMDQLAWFSNYGTVGVDVVAPGIRIYSLDNGLGLLWSENFDDGNLDGWTTGGTGNDWGAAPPPYGQATNALASSPNEDYDDDADTWVQSPALDLTTASASQLSFYLIGSSQANADFLHLDVSTDGLTWYNRPLLVGAAVHNAGISGTLPYWIAAKADLGPWDGEPQVYLRFRFRSDATGTDSGFYVDDIMLNAGAVIDNYQFMQGTSMAAGFVSGMAALVQSENPSLSPTDVKAIIQKSVDLNLDLFDLTLSGGRVNAHNALTLLRELTLSASQTESGSVQLLWTAQAQLNAEVVIERRADGEMEFSIIDRVDAQSTGYVDSAPSPGTIYCYRVQAETIDGRYGYSNQSMATTVDTVTTSGSGGGGGSGGSGGCFISRLLNP